MHGIFHPLPTLIASATDKKLARYVEFLKEENKILRARIPGQIHTRPDERKRILKLGLPIGRAIEELITIVTASTFYRWVRDEKCRTSKKTQPNGGQRKPQGIRALVIKIASATGFAYTRIFGELRKLGIRKISRQTIRNILLEEGIKPVPDRSSDNFIRRHGATLWAADFFSVRTVTKRGLRDMYVLVFFCMETRELIVSDSTEHPNSAWVSEQAERFLNETSGRDVRPSILDRDSKFSKPFTDTLAKRNVRTNPLPVCSPNLNGRCERVILTIKSECLSKSLIFGKRHLDYLVAEFAAYYITARSHMERDHLPPLGEEPDDVETIKLNEFEVKSYVGGPVKSFERRAA